jgi:ATP-dependent helicase/nuclease subunit B
MNCSFKSLLAALILLCSTVATAHDFKVGGIFYKPSKRDTSNKGLAMNGLVPADENLVRAMEKEANGEFVPKLTIKKDGTVSKASDSFIDFEDFDLIFKHLEKTMKNTGNLISSGDIEVSPVNGRENEACKYCEFASVCGIEDTEAKQVEAMKNSAVLDAIKEEENVD